MRLEDVSIYFCKKELSHLVRGISTHFLDGTNYRQAGDMGKGKMRLRTLHLESVVEMPHDFRGEDIVSMGMGKVKDSWLMPTAFKFLFITLITSGSVSLMHCYLYNHFLEPQSVLPSRLVFLAHKKYLCFLKYFTLLIHISMRLP